MVAFATDAKVHYLRQVSTQDGSNKKFELAQYTCPARLMAALRS
jgi:hypothetical protein